MVVTVVMVGPGPDRTQPAVCGTHQRNQALCAAEAGIYALFARLDNQPSFVVLRVRYKGWLNLHRPLPARVRDLTIRSTGMLGSGSRSLRTTINSPPTPLPPSARRRHPC